MNGMTRIGTNNFVSISAATRYYSSQGDDRREIEKKINEGRILFGTPKVPYGQSVRIHPSEGRYYIIVIPVRWIPRLARLKL